MILRTHFFISGTYPASIYIHLSFSITPYDVEPDRRHENFNFAHSSTRMTIERTFGKFKSQWKLFASIFPHYYPEQTGLFLQAAFVMHNVTISIDQDTEPYPDDPHLSVGDERPSADLEEINSGRVNNVERRSAAEAKKIRNDIKDYLELFVQ